MLKLIFLLSYFLYIANSKFTFELFRQKTYFEQYLNNVHSYSEVFSQLEKKNKRTNDSISIYKYLDNQFYGKIIIGHPGQTLNVAFDTTWDNIWVLSSKCSALKTIGCYFHNKYDHSKSSEYRKDGRPYILNMGSYNLTGFYSYDNISIAHSNITNQRFVELVNVPYSFIFNKADGVMGLGLKTGEDDPFFYKLLKQKKIKDPIFSIYLNRDTQSIRGGNIMLGFIDTKHIHKNRINNKTIPEEITYLPVDKTFYWRFNMDRLVVNPKKATLLCQSGCKAIVDTNSNSIRGPKADIDQIHDLIDASELLWNRYTVNCDLINKLPLIDFVLANKNFTLSGPQYTVKMSYKSFTVCVSAFIPQNDLDFWVLGGAFLSEYYSIYNINEQKIGFVKAA